MTPPRCVSERGTTPMAGQLVAGLFVIALGVVFTLDNLDLIRARDYLRYWPVGLMVLGVVKMSSSGEAGTRFLGFLLMLAGGSLLLGNLGIITARIWDFWPLLLVAGGALLVWRGWRGPAAPEAQASADSGDVVSGVAVLSGVDRTIDSQAFRGGEVTALMGGGRLDLRRARIAASPAVIQVFAVMGGLELRVPDDWVVENKIVAFLGGVDDRTRRGAVPSTQRLILRGFVMMGGVEIRN